MHLEKRLRDLVAFLDGTGRDYEVLIVEDGSVDESLPILRRLEVDVPSINVLRNPRNMGKGYSIRNGILNSRGKYIIFTDIDMAYAKRNLLAVLERLEQGDPFVVGNRRLPESVYVVNNRLVKYVYRRHRMGNRLQCARARAVWPDDARHAERIEGIFEERRGADISAALHGRLSVRYRDFHSQSNPRHSRRRSSGPADI